jgi:hypothetical protein
LKGLEYQVTWQVAWTAKIARPGERGQGESAERSHNLALAFGLIKGGFLLSLTGDFALAINPRFLYLAAMFKATVIILGIIWASLLLISWSGAESRPVQVHGAAQVQTGF